MKRTLHYLLLVVVWVGSTALASAQITGQITDATDGSPLIGATVQIEGTSSGTVTDIEGNYQINASPEDVLIFNFVGYSSKRVTVGSQTTINVALEVAITEMNEIVVIGYGIQEKKVATGSIGKIDAEQIDGFQVANISSTMDGIVPGLIVNQSSGQPGTGASILIRGISTNGDNSPLYIVDGLTVDNINNINPNDVESVNVLKDAASTAIYGARAANGVVIITTKKGEGDSGQITYEAFTSVSNPWRVPEMLNADDYVSLTREKFANSNQSTALDIVGFPTSAAGLPNTNWMDQIFDRASINRHTLSATLPAAFISLEYWDENGVIGGEKSNFKRYAVRVNSAKDINEYVSLGQNLYINRTENNQLGTNNAFGTVIADAFALDPITNVYDENAQYGFAQSQWVQKEYVNPLSRMFLANNYGHGDEVQGNVYLEIKPIDKLTESLTFRSDFGMRYGWGKGRSFVPDYSYHPAFVNVGNDVSQSYGYGQRTQFENYINYKKEFAEHSIDIVAGTTYITEDSEWSGSSTSFIPQDVMFDPNWQYIDAGQDTMDLAYGGGAVKYRLISYFGRAIYEFRDKYLFTATLRRDGSSRFGANNRWGVFPSFSAGWIISDENFFDFNNVSFLKLRGSWGVNGNDRIGDLRYASTIENVFTYSFGQNQVLYRGAALATPPNPNLKWEESRQIDIGIEANFFGDQLTTELDFYRKETKDLLMDEVIPGYIGATNNPTSNLGSIRNTGIEAMINYSWTTGDLDLNLGLQYTTFRNEVTEVAGEAGYLNGWSWPVRNTVITRMTEGYPVGHFVGYEMLGVFQSQADVFGHINAQGDPLQPNAKPGDLKFADTNGDGVINSDDIDHLGDPWADHILGLTGRASYKGFDFSMIWSAQLGHEIFRSYERSDVTYTNYQTFWLDRWTETNPSTEYPRLVTVDANNNQRPSSFYLQDGSFLRLRNVQVGYNIPNSLLEKVKLTAARIYVSGNNLLTITGYQGFDPEIGSGGWILDTGIDKGYYPSNKTVGAGIKITM